ncbi:MAG: hypothetical protein NVS3B10_26080 [Polyangiales bacterium]
MLAGAACRSAPQPSPSPPTAPNPAPEPTATSTTSAAAATETAAPTAAPPPVAADASPKPGDAAPSLVATASNGAKIDLAALAAKGKVVVVYFYPKDDTPGCTKEACAFRDTWTKLEKANVIVIGVSEDDDKSHEAFRKKHKLPIPLLADVDGAIAKKFGVPVEGGYAHRVSVMIGKDGKVKKIYPQVDPAVHADQVLADAAS